ncbi:hypothetical protein [Orientia tsutsugamushi]|uniref:hypothetical protein n=1 Tax=Orientia tsutsugamushi TaxID=784 RepID=UPI000ACD6913|nr:hypothetical protein [Orientia tsutsugamushi]
MIYLHQFRKRSSLDLIFVISSKPCLASNAASVLVYIKIVVMLILHIVQHISHIKLKLLQCYH